MGKLSNLLSMINILQSGRKYTINELAEKLEVTPRMIRFYKDELEKAGVYVDSISGVYGGYVLNQKLSSISVGCTKEDINLLNIINDYIKEKSDFIFGKEYTEFINKISTAYERNENRKALNVPYMDYHLNEKDTEEEIKKYNKLNYAIKNKNKVKIKYASINSRIKDRIVHPCGLFVYNNYWYLSAFCEFKNQTRSFLLSRIISYELLNETF